MKNHIISLAVALTLSTLVGAQGPAGKDKPDQAGKKTETHGDQEDHKQHGNSNGQKGEHGKSEHENGDQDKGKSEKGKPELNHGASKEKDDDREDQDKKEKDDENGSKGQGHAYGQNKGELSGREFGQQRASEARAKHEAEKPKTETEAKEKVVVIQQRNEVLLSDTEKKIIAFRKKLEELKKAGKITAEEMNQKLKTLEAIEKRRADIQKKIKN